MSDVPESHDPPPADPHDSVVEQAVERAAVKVAQAASPVVNGTPVLSKLESIAVVAVMVVIGLMNLGINIATRNALEGHQKDFKEMCQAFIDFTPPERASELAERFAECLK